MEGASPRWQPGAARGAWPWPVTAASRCHPGIPQDGPPPCALWCRLTPQSPGHRCCFEAWLEVQALVRREVEELHLGCGGLARDGGPGGRPPGPAGSGGAGSAILPLLPGSHLLGDGCWGPGLRGRVPGPLWLSLSSQGGPAGGGGRWAFHPPGYSRDSHTAERSDMGREGVSRSPRPGVSAAVPGRAAVGAQRPHHKSDGPRGAGATVCWAFCVALTTTPMWGTRSGHHPHPNTGRGRGPRGAMMWAHGSFLHIFSEASFFTSETEATPWARR